MNWFDRWFAKKSKYVWDESRKQGNGLAPSRADFDFLKTRVEDLERDMRTVFSKEYVIALRKRIDMLEDYLNLEVDDEPRYRLKREIK